MAFRLKIQRGAGDTSREHGKRHSQPCRHAGTMPPNKLSKQVTAARWSGPDRLIVQVAAQIIGQVIRTAITAGKILLQRLQDDPIEITFEQRLA